MGEELAHCRFRSVDDDLGATILLADGGGIVARDGRAVLPCNTAHDHRSGLEGMLRGNRATFWRSHADEPGSAARRDALREPAVAVASEIRADVSYRDQPVGRIDGAGISCGPAGSASGRHYRGGWQTSGPRPDRVSARLRSRRVQVPNGNVQSAFIAIQVIGSAYIVPGTKRRTTEVLKKVGNNSPGEVPLASTAGNAGREPNLATRL